MIPVVSLVSNTNNNKIEEDFKMADDGQYSDARVPCKVCGRSFAPEVLQKHAKICQKTAVNSQKRKVFDSTKQRVVEGTTLRQLKQVQKKDTPAPKSHWREKHADFINTIRNARGVSQAMASGGPLPPPPPPSINPDYIQCPYCSRRFNQQSAERHMNFCKEQQSRLPRSKPSADATAKQNARLGYQAPKLKPKTGPAAAAGSAGSVGMARGGPAGRGGAAPRGTAAARGRGAPSQLNPKRTHSVMSGQREGDFNDGRAGRGRQPQHGRANSFDQHQDKYSRDKKQSRGVPRAHTFEQQDQVSGPSSSRTPHHQQQQRQPKQHQHFSYADQNEDDQPKDFFNTPEDFYTPYASPRHKLQTTTATATTTFRAPGDTGDATGGGSSSYKRQALVGGYSRTNKNNTNNNEYNSKNYSGSQSSRQTNGSDSPYSNVEERSRKADGVPVRAKASPDSQLHYVDESSYRDGVSPMASGRAAHPQSTPAPFCYECGARYPVITAKFCCQCGVKRTVCK